MTRGGWAWVVVALGAWGCSDDSSATGAGGQGGAGVGGGAPGGGGLGGAGGSGAAASCFGTVSDDPIVNEAADVLRAHLEETDTPGGAVIVVRNGQPVARIVAGSKSAFACDPITEDTLFGAQSASQILTALAVLSAVDEGLLDLEAPIGEVVPELHAGNGDTSEITLHQVLAQTSTYYDDLDRWYQSGGCSSLSERIDGAPNPILYGEPGTMHHTFLKSTFMIAGLALENEGGEAFPDAMKARVLEPLGMGGGYEPSLLDGGDYSLGHYAPEVDDTLHLGCRNLDPADGYYGSARDFEKLLMYLTGGAGDVLAPTTRAAMLAPQGVHFWSTDHTVYGLSGWDVPDIDDTELYTNSLGFGFQSATLVYPTRGLAIIALLNSTYANATILTRDLGRVFDPSLEEIPGDEFDADPALAPEYAGTFIDPIGYLDSGPRTLTVTLEPDQLTGFSTALDSDGDSLPLTLEPFIGQDNFLATELELPVRFWRDETGAVYAVSFDRSSGPPFYRVP